MKYLDAILAVARDGTVVVQEILTAELELPGLRPGRIMRLPRWLVILMLTASILAPLAFAGWWWETWPERTAREFQRLLVQQNWDDAGAMLLYAGMDYPPDTIMAWLAGSRQGEFTLEPQPWSWADVCRGRRHYKLGEKRVVWFIAEKGRITEWNTWSSARFQRPAQSR